MRLPGGEPDSRCRRQKSDRIGDCARRPLAHCPDKDSNRGRTAKRTAEQLFRPCRAMAAGFDEGKRAPIPASADSTGGEVSSSSRPSPSCKLAFPPHHFVGFEKQSSGDHPEPEPQLRPLRLPPGYKCRALSRFVF